MLIRAPVIRARKAAWIGMILLTRTLTVERCIGIYKSHLIRTYWLSLRCEAQPWLLHNGHRIISALVADNRCGQYKGVGWHPMHRFSLDCDRPSRPLVCGRVLLQPSSTTHIHTHSCHFIISSGHLVTPTTTGVVDTVTCKGSD